MFEFRMRGSADGKSTILCITSISTPRGKTQTLPDHLQPITLHTELAKTQVAARIKNTLKKRNQFRKVWITLTTDLTKTYLDEDENLFSNDEYLEKITEREEKVNTGIDSQNETLQKLLEKLLEEKQQKSEVQNLSKIAKDFTIEKFDEKNLNANQWLIEFEKECERCTIHEDRKKIEILKLFLEKASMDWYTCMILKFTVESKWDWKKNFSETFGSKGWSPIRYAYIFKYKTGSLLEYAIKKEKLLLQVRKSIDTHTLIDLIAINLPNEIADKIDRESLESTQDLYNELSKLEYMTRKKKIHTGNKTACKICENANKGKRFHPEEECWFKGKTNKPNQIKTMNNNALLEVEINEDD